MLKTDRASIRLADANKATLRDAVNILCVKKGTWTQFKGKFLYNGPAWCNCV